MTNKKHYAQLKKDVKAWNKWRAIEPDIIPDLIRANLTWADLSGADLSGADLSGAKLFKANLSGADLSGAKLFKANLSRTNLSGADLSGAKLFEANLTWADLSGADLSGAKLIETNLSGAKLIEANLSKANLTWADLSKANLRGADLSEADLSGANLTWAYLNEANLIMANLGRTNINKANLSKAKLSKAKLNGLDLSRRDLSGLDLSGADISRANLSRTQALGTDFTGAKFTGACLEDWNINSATKLDNIDCQYVYLKNDKQERRPSKGDFAPGEFTKLFQKALETVDLIFADGIDWKAFLFSFQELQAKYGEENLSVQAIEKKSGGAFIIRLEVPQETNKAEIETQAKELYEHKLNVLEVRYHNQLKAKDEQIAIYRQQNTDLTEIVKLMAERPIQNIIDVTAKAESNSMSESYQSKYDQRNSNNQFVDTAQTGSNPTFNQNNSSEQKKTLAEAASEIQKLLKQLEETNPTATETEKVAYVNDETTPSFKRRVVGAFQAGGETAIDEFILENKYLKVAKAAIKGWLQPGS
jgi:uncharacterized protein YjbI with pentapeptide repeats